MEVRVITPSNPLDLITLQEAKDYLKVDYANDDLLITSLIKASFKAAERFTNSSILTKTLEVRAEWQYLTLPYGPIMAVNGLSYYDYDNLEVVLPAEDYSFRGTSILFHAGGFYGSLPKYLIFRVEYIAGLPAIQVDEDIKIAILKNVYDLYETRGNQVVAAQGVNVGVSNLSKTTKDLLYPHRRMFI